MSAYVGARRRIGVIVIVALLAGGLATTTLPRRATATSGDTTTRLSVSAAADEGDGHSNSVLLSADGSLTAFDTRAENLVAGDANGLRDVVLRGETPGQPRTRLGELERQPGQ